MDGLARAALAGGASAVIASLSDLDDRETTSILVELHHLLASGLSEEEALRRAQLAAHLRGTPAGAWSPLQLLVR
jgi:CHAT domain-containing protein